MNDDLPVYHDNTSDVDKLFTLEAMARQFKPLLDACTQEFRMRLRVECATCEKKVVVWHAYRCLYCGLFFCRGCAERHFGKKKPVWDTKTGNPIKLPA